MTKNMYELYMQAYEEDPDNGYFAIIKVATGGEEY